jgi:hypothetical protein
VADGEPAGAAVVELGQRARPRVGFRGDLGQPAVAPLVEAMVAALGCRALSVSWRAVDAAGVRRAADAGLEIAARTVRRRPTFVRLERLGVVAVCAEAAALDG